LDMAESELWGQILPISRRIQQKPIQTTNSKFDRIFKPCSSVTQEYDAIK
jgi:hypothetical protein